MKRRALAVVLAVAAVLIVSLGVAAVGMASADPLALGSTDGPGIDEPRSAVGVEFAVGEVDPDDVLLGIDLDGEGNAEWTIEYRTRLDTDDDEAAFEELRRDIEADPEAYTVEFADRMSATAEGASTATGREMAISDMRVDAERRQLPREYGIVTYTFQWSNFAAVDGDRIAAGDAIDGLFLDDASELRIGWPDDRALVEATPSPTETRETAVVWRGPTSFAEGQPRAVLDSAAATDTGAGDDQGTDGESAPASDGAVSSTMVAVFAVVLLVVAGTYVARRGWIGPIGRIDRSDRSGDDATDTRVGSGAVAADTNDASDEDDTDDTTAEVDATDAADGDDAADDEDVADTQTAGPFGDVDPELLSNEEQVLRLIEANGGRMKQKRVAEELDWTAAKTSQVTKGLREEGDLVGFRLGRENVLALPEEDPR
ncbi:DUF4897 domain-containing protein [Halorubrum sp. JWXQ-INN 858]|uniref:DUF7345 domain-containing protein n=1 Tax=Halorubrum sp. JWXQ-INN 858 TaxID=2690782 RepID=UPI002AA29B4F|nr:DUF4897 domain-containing protein [Halorubrum sp. JWXQ-INN 858]